MKVFISWSGERSKRVGEIFNKILPCIIQSCEPYFSSETDKGSRWFSEISKKLEKSDIGIICLTKENISAPWLLFESGALSKKLEQSRVCPFLLDLEPTDLTGPLAQFQATKNDENEIYKLIITINESSDKPLPEDTLKRTFEQWWPILKKDLESVPEPSEKKQENKPMREDRELLEEVLNTVRKFEKISMYEQKMRTRYSGVEANWKVTFYFIKKRTHFNDVDKIINAIQLLFEDHVGIIRSYPDGFEMEILLISGEKLIEKCHEVKDKFKEIDYYDMERVL